MTLVIKFGYAITLLWKSYSQWEIEDVHHGKQCSNEVVLVLKRGNALLCYKIVDYIFFQTAFGCFGVCIRKEKLVSDHVKLETFV